MNKLLTLRQVKGLVHSAGVSARPASLIIDSHVDSGELSSFLSPPLWPMRPLVVVW